MFQPSLSRLLGGSLLCASLMPAAALAQAEPKGFYATIYSQSSRIGSSTFTESGALGGGSGLRAEFGSGLGLGGDIGYRYCNGWAAEIEWNYRSHSLDALRQGTTTLARDGDFASNIFLVNGLRRFSARGAWTPYLGAGIGWVQEIDIDLAPGAGAAERGYSTSGKVAFQLIGGVEYAITPQWRLTADARWLRVGSVRLNNETANPGGTAGPLKYNPLSVQVGVRYSF
jgi:opacity protein-like surface antigen